MSGSEQTRVVEKPALLPIPAEQQVPRLRFLVRCAAEQTSLGMTVLTIPFREREDARASFAFISRSSMHPSLSL
jgi:hypothetical protein